VNVLVQYLKAIRTLPVYAILATMTSSIWAADPVVSNISAAQRAGTKMVDVGDEVIATNFESNTANSNFCHLRNQL
jgi:hypothetical protein